MSQGSRYKKVEINLSKGPKPRKFFDESGGVTCRSCFSLRNENADLKEKVKRLEGLLKYREKKGDLNAHTPSSRIDYKENSQAENQLKKGGAKLGHKGHGREACKAELADEVIKLAAPKRCNNCDTDLNAKDSRERTVIESVPLVAKKVVYRCERGICPKCFRIYPSHPPVLRKSLYGNSLLAQAAVMHFVHGITIGKVLTILGENVTFGGIMDAFHRLGRIAQKGREQLINDFRNSAVKHADETGWRNDGASGYAWIFVSPSVSIFEFRNSRSAKVAKEIMGEKPLPGVLVVDRYPGYNQMPINLQYCYAHLLREVTKLEEDFPENAEVRDFTSRFATALTAAIKLRGKKQSLAEFREMATSIKKSIEAMVAEEHKHLGIKKIQQIFWDQRERLYHWAKDPDIPAENNRAERELRPTVIARKVSFGSQSDAGAKTRGSIMTLLGTAKKRLHQESLEDWFKSALDKISENPELNIASLLPPMSTPSN